MLARNRTYFWIGVMASACLFIWLLWDAILPFLIGLTLAYLLDPLAHRLERWGLPRLAAACVILLGFVLVIAVIIALIVPLVSGQFAGLIESLPALTARVQELVNAYVRPVLRRFGGEQVLNDMQSSVGQIVTQAASWSGGLLQSVWSSGQSVISIVALFVVAPVVAFYMLVDWGRMVAAIDSWIPPRQRNTVRMLARQIDRAIAGFIRGQALVCLFLGAFYAIGLSVVGLNYGVAIGVVSGFLTFIPYVGSFIGLLISLTVAVVQFWPDWGWILAVLAVYVTGQFLEGNIVSPLLVGDAVGLHPVWLMFALVAFGSLFGFIGILLAVPLGAAIAVLVRFGLRQYLASSLYDDGYSSPPSPPSPPGGDA